MTDMTTLPSTLGTLLLSVCLATGCAHSGASDGSTGSSGSPQSSTTATSKKGLICRNERPTGSNLTREVCRPAAQVDEDRDRAQSIMQNAPRAPSREIVPGT
jgi:hypothetical protein